MFFSSKLVSVRSILNLLFQEKVELLYKTNPNLIDSKLCIVSKGVGDAYAGPPKFQTGYGNRLPSGEYTSLPPT